MATYLEDVEVELMPRPPCSNIVNGMSRAGKTFLAVNSILLNHEYLWPGYTVKRCVVVYRFYQSYFDKLKEHFGDRLLLTKSFSAELLDSIGRTENKKEISFLTLDDCFHEYLSDPTLVEVFISRVHHQSIIAVAITHDLYGSKGRAAANLSTIKKNCSCLIQMKQATIGQTLIELQK